MTPLGLPSFVAPPCAVAASLHPSSLHPLLLWLLATLAPPALPSLR